MVCTFCKDGGPIVAIDGSRDEVQILRLSNERIVTAHFGCTQDFEMDRAEDRELT